MNKKILGVLLGIGVLIIGCGCTSTQASCEGTKRYIVTGQQYLKGYKGCCDDEIINITDIKTGDEYLLYKGYRKGSLIRVKEGTKNNTIKK